MFEIVERDGLARICAFHTRRGTIETPCLLPVVNPNINTIPPKSLYEEFGIRAVITNSYIILKKKSLKESAMNKGVHELLDFPGIIMTDSGTFQSHLYSKIEATNKEIVEFQRDIGSDIGMPLDVFTEPDWERDRTAQAITQTIVRTKEASEIKGEMLLGGVVQGSLFPDLREQCAREMSTLPVDIHPIGGVVPLMENYRFADLVDVIVASKKGLVPNRPVHLFGAGHPMVFALAVLLGCDTFDSASYAKFARDGRFMFSSGTYRLEDMKKLVCDCPACRGHDIDSIREMNEEERTDLIARHNLYESIAEIERIKKAILEGTLWEFVEMRCRSHPALLDGLRRLANYKEFLEKYEPLSRESAFFYTGPESLDRPSVYRYERRFFERYTQPLTQILVGFEDSDKPYTTKYAREIEEISAICDAHFVIMSPLGPIPIELDEIYPIAQSVFPKIRDKVLIEKTHQLMERMSHIQKYGMCIIYDGEETKKLLESIAKGKSTFNIDIARVTAVADYQFGKGAADLLFSGEITFIKSKNTGRIRNVIVDGKHILSMRASDGFFSLKIAGATKLHAGFSSPRMRVVVQQESAEFNQKGRNVFCKFVVDCDENIRPMDEVLVVDENDHLVACGRSLLTRDEMLSFERGLAVLVREGIIQ